jgi:hypothetical protein
MFHLLDRVSRIKCVVALDVHPRDERHQSFQLVALSREHSARAQNISPQEPVGIGLVSTIPKHRAASPAYRWELRPRTCQCQIRRN